MASIGDNECECVDQICATDSEKETISDADNVQHFVVTQQYATLSGFVGAYGD